MRMMVGILVHAVITTMILLAPCSGNNFLGPRNITRAEGTEDIHIPCQSYPPQATPFWKINGTIYYFSDVPPPFKASKSGREITIPVVDSILDGTSFQCFTPSSTRDELISSTIGFITVRLTENIHSNSQVPSSINDPQPKMVLIHQNLTFSPTAIKITWRVIINDRRCAHYQLIGSQSCDASSNAMVIINRTGERTVNILEPNILSNLTYFSLTIYDKGGQQCTHDLESFKFSPESITVDVSLCMSDFPEDESCSPTPTCVEVPPLTMGRTLVLALPFLPAITEPGLEEDLLCPVHPLPGEGCVDLFSCNRFRESAYANFITICRTKNDSSVLEMCFHNVTDIMNGTRLHFFYSDLHCRPEDIQLESSRTYVKSMQLLSQTTDVNINDSGICITSKCHCEKMFKISIRDKLGCTIYSQNVSSSGNNCTSFIANAGCIPYHVKVEDDNKLIYNGSITGYARSSSMPPSTVSSSECTCYSSQSTTSTWSLAIGVCAIFGVIILILFAAVIAVAHRNYGIIISQ